MNLAISRIFGCCAPSDVAPLPPSQRVLKQIPSLGLLNVSTAPFRIGYHLTGSFDDQSSYDLTLFPNESNPIAQVTAGKETLKLEVQLKIPTALSSQEVANALFAKNLSVTKHETTSFENRHVEVLCGQRNAFPVNVDVRVESTVNGQPYQLDLNTTDITTSKVAIQNPNSKNYDKIDLDIGNLRPLLSKDLQKHLPKLAENLSVDLLQQPARMSINLNQVIPDPSSPTTPTLSTTSMLQVHDVRGLCRLLKAGSSDAATIAQGMVNCFTQHNFPSEDEIDEIGELIGKTTPHDGFRLINSLVSRLDKDALQDEATLQLLSKVLGQYQQLRFQKAWELARKNINIDYLSGLTAPHLVRILSILTDNLNTTHIQDGQVSVVKEQLRAIIALLDMMAIRKVDQVESELHKKAYRAIERFKGHSDLQIAYFASLGTQSFTLIPDNQTRTEALLNRAFLLLQGLAKVNIDPTNPWGILSLIYALPDIKEAFTFQDRQHKWFAQLLAVRQMIFGGKPDNFFAFEEGLRNKLADVQKQMDLHNTSFVVGFVDLLWEVLLSTKTGNSTQDSKLKILAVNLYAQIHDNNEGDTKKKEDYPFIIEASYRPQLRHLIIERLKQCTTHSLKPVSDAAKKILEARKVFVPANVKTLDPRRIPTELYNKSVQNHKPLLITLQSMQDALLNLDKQFENARPYFIPLDAKVPRTTDVKPLDSFLNEFLKNKNRVLTIAGAGGAGKSLGIKTFASQLLETYTEEDYFPIYVPLPRLTDPVNHAVAETLEGHGIEPSDLQKKQALLARKTLWIFDAYDELPLEKLDAVGRNIYKTNKLDALGPKAKVIFLYRTSSAVVPSDVFKPDGESVQELIIEPFSQAKIIEYLDRFCDVRTQNPLADRSMDLLWTKEQYRENFNILQRTNFWDIITNPFRLRINAEVLPIIAKILNVDPGNLFKGDQKSVIENRIFTYFACVRALRAARKMNQYQKVDAVKFITYQARVAERMRLHGINAIPQDMDKRISNLFGDLFIGLDRDTMVPNRFFSKELEEGIVNNQKVWTFMHDDYQKFFDSINFTKRTEDAKREMLAETITQEKFDALFGHD